MSDPSFRPEILVLAYECSPDRGSESGAGFAVLSGLVEVARCTVLVGTADAASLEAWSRRHHELGVTVVPVDDSALGRALYRVHHYTQFISYLLWLRRATPRLLELAATGRFRVVWHATYSPAWLPTPLRHVHHLPTVWGPCTGADRVPGPLRGALMPRSRVRDVLDNLSTWCFSRLPSTRRSLQSVDLMLLALDNAQVRKARSAPTEVFVQTALVDVPPVDEPIEREDCLYFTSALRAQKGPLLAIEAAARNPRVRLVVAPPGRGQMRAQCERIVRQYGAESRINFIDGVSRPDMLRRLCGSKGFVHSAISDVASMALAEALVVGVPVVALDVPGARAMKEYVNRPALMPLVPVLDPEQVIDDLGRHMVELLESADDIREPLLDQVALRRQFGGYIEHACGIHQARQAGRDAVDTMVGSAVGKLPQGSRIVQLLYMVQDRGGEVVAHRLAKGFRERGYPTHNVGVYRESPVTTSTADFEILYAKRPSSLGNVGCFVHLVRVLRRERPAAVILHGDFAQVIGAPAAILAGVRQRIVVNHLALGIFVKRLRYMHTALGVLGVYRHIVFVGESARRSADGLPRRFLDRSSVIENTVSLEAGDGVAGRARFGIPADTTVFLNVGSLTEQKNQQILIAAMSAIPDGILVIAGDGPLAAELETAAGAAGERVRLIGRVPIDEIADVYAMADVFVFPSRYEGRPLSLLEAATAGLPILATPIPENVEVTGTAAHYIDGDDLAGWIDAMRRTVHDRAFRNHLAAQTRLLDVGSEDVTMDAYLRLMT
ncbi:MAG TPA: glycosyltransferase [Acidimicrobiales bacterium]|nr:glycosyltransferase [Acidimicrobiales bacterium]